MKSVNQAVLFTNRRFTSADMVKQLVKSIRFYYVTKEGYENAVDYQMSQLGNEVALFDNPYTNVTYETYPYGYSSGQDNVTGQIPGISGATYWAASYVRFGVPGLKWNVTINLNQDTQTLTLSWNIQWARQDWIYNINGTLQPTNNFTWNDNNSKIYPIAGSKSYTYGTNQQALNYGARNAPPNKQDLLNMTYINIGNSQSTYDMSWIKQIYNTYNSQNYWPNSKVVQKFSITKIELIPYNN